LPVMNTAWVELFSVPERNRPLLLNDGQPFSGTQTVRLHFTSTAPADLPSSWQTEVASEKFSITWRRVDANTLERTTLVEFSKPMIEVGDYAAVRHAVYDWNVR